MLLSVHIACGDSGCSGASFSVFPTAARLAHRLALPLLDAGQPRSREARVGLCGGGARKVNPTVLTERDANLSELENALSNLRGVDSKAVRAAAIRAGTTSKGMPPCLRYDDPVGHSARLVSLSVEGLALLQFQWSVRLAPSLCYRDAPGCHSSGRVW
jgi:hypothetical protein